MRHDPAIASIVIMLRELKMHGMAQAVAELAEQGAPAFKAAQPILSQLLKAETAEREVRSVAYQLKVARFPAYGDLAGFDFSHSEINEALVRQLHRCEFLENANNVVLVGGPGTGKTHIATALGVQAIEHHHRRVRFFSTVELVNALEEEKAQSFEHMVELYAGVAPVDMDIAADVVPIEHIVEMRAVVLAGRSSGDLADELLFDVRADVQLVAVVALTVFLGMGGVQVFSSALGLVAVGGDTALLQLGLVLFGEALDGCRHQGGVDDLPAPCYVAALQQLSV